MLNQQEYVQEHNHIGEEDQNTIYNMSGVLYLTNIKPGTYFKEFKDRFSKWADKISFFECPQSNGLKNWDYEYYQRDFIRECLVKLKCNDEDLVFISDVDEIINIDYILSRNRKPPFRIEVPFYYYFINVKASENWQLNLCSKWSDLKHSNIGNRTTYHKNFPEILLDDKGLNGAHFSYLYSYSIKDYQNKIMSFSHSEYNNFYFKNYFHLKYCISSLKDIYNRNWIQLKIDDQNNIFMNSNSEIRHRFKAYYPQQNIKFQLCILKIYLYVLNMSYRFSLRLKILPSISR